MGSLHQSEYLKANPTDTPSAFDWYNIELWTIASESFVVILVLAFSFIRLYIGSMLKEPTKT